jgi:hypothetical protein
VFVSDGVAELGLLVELDLVASSDSVTGHLASLDRVGHDALRRAFGDGSVRLLRVLAWLLQGIRSG